MTTVYTVKNNGVSFQTTETETAEQLSKQGARVTTHYTEKVKQTEDDKGTLIMSHSPDWVEDSPAVCADQDSWINVMEMQ